MKTTVDQLPSSLQCTSRSPSRSHTCPWAGSWVLAPISRAAAKLVLEVSGRPNTQSRHQGQGLRSVSSYCELFCHGSSMSLGTRVARTFLQEESCRKATSPCDKNAESSDCRGLQHQFLPSQRDIASVKFVVRYSLLSLLTAGGRSHLAFVESSVVIVLKIVPIYLLPTYLSLCSALPLGQ